MSDRVFLTVGVFSRIKPILLAVHSMSPDRPIVKFESCQQGIIFDIYELFSFRHVSKSWVFFLRVFLFCLFVLYVCFLLLFFFLGGGGAGAEGGFCWRDTSISTLCSLLSLWGSVLLLTNDINSQQKPQLLPVDNSLLLHIYLFLFFGLWGALREWRFRPGDIRRRVQP